MSVPKKKNLVPRHLKKNDAARDFAEDLNAAAAAKSQEKGAELPTHETKIEKEPDPIAPVLEEKPSPDTSRRSRKGKPSRKKNHLFVYLIAAASLVVLCLMLFFSWHYYHEGYKQGIEQGVVQAKETARRENVAWPPEVVAELDAGMVDLRNGDAASALRRFQKLEDDQHPVSSVTYLVALAAMQNGDIDLAEKKARESMDKQERISDSLALLAVLETQKGADSNRYKFGDSSLKSEEFLRQAILADSANPYPRYELATLLRYKGRRDEAIKEVEAAQARLNPIDSHMVMEITLALLKLEQTPVEKLPVEAPQSDDVRKVFPAAYAAMRRGDFAQAATLLQKCQAALAPDVFDYLVNDPAMRKFKDRPELQAFFGN